MKKLWTNIRRIQEMVFSNYLPHIYLETKWFDESFLKIMNKPDTKKCNAEKKNVININEQILFHTFHLFLCKT